MLTNNKKSYFVKSIAMIMAVLMVLAVCLTGCGNKAAEEAAQKAENAQTTATEAKTAADAVKASLEEYLKKADAVTVAAVTAEIEKALGGYAKTADLADFVKSGDLTALSNKLADYVKTADLSAKVKEAIGAYVTPAQLTEVENSLKALITAADGKAATVKAEIEEILKGYVKAADLKAATDKVAALETALNTKVEGLQNQINTLSSKIGTDITAALVTYATKAEVEALGTRLDKLEEVVRAILDAFYTEEEVETLEGSAFEDLLDLPAATITMLIKDKMSLTEWNKTTPEVIKTIDAIQTMLSKIYKAAGVDEQADAYTKAAKDQINKCLEPLNIVMFDKDYKVTSYNKNAKNLEYTILRVATLKELNELKKAVENANAVLNFKEELANLYNTLLFTIGDEHTATEPKDKKVQTVTIANKGEINAFVEAYDALIIKYLTDAAGNAFNFNTEYAKTYGKQAMMNVFTDGTKFVVTTETKEYKVGDVTWTDTGIDTILIENKAGADLANRSTWKEKDAYGLIYLPQDIEEFDWFHGETEMAKVNGHYGSKKDLEVAKTFKDAEDTLKAVIEQTYDAQDLVNTANKTFADFLAIVKANGTIKDGAQDKKLSEVANPTDDQYLEALTVGMCTPVDPDGANGTYKYDLYLLNKVKEDMRAAMARNTCKDEDDKANNHTDVLKAAITKYDLYMRMYDKAWDLVFELYRVYAQDMLKLMLADYISVIDNFKYEAAKTTPAMPAQNATTIVESDGFRAAYEFKGQISPDFLNAFLGGATFAGWTSSAAGDQAAIVITKNFANTALVNYYGETNGKAHTAADKAIVANPAKTILDNSEYLNMYLTASVQNIVNNIRYAEKDTVKGDAKYYNDIDLFFEELLTTAVANLDEVYNRFLFEDYKADKINETYVFATTIAKFFSRYEDTVLIEAMEHYLTGYSVTKASAPAEGETDNKLFPANGLTNASMTAEFASVDVDKFKMIDGVNAVNLIGTEAMGNIDKKVDAYETKLENMAIKDNYLSYLDVATVNVARAYLNYMGANGLTYEMINGLVAARNLADTAITVQKFQEEMGTIKIDEYKERYENLLVTVIASKDNVDHLGYLTAKETADTTKKEAQMKFVDAATAKKAADDYFAEALKAVKSSTTPAHGYVETAVNNVVRPVNALGDGAVGCYDFIGEAIVEFDKVVNVNTKYYTKADKSETANLY